MQLAVLVIFDGEARILWASWLHPDYKGGIGSYAWDHVPESDRGYVRAAAMRCLRDRKRALIEAAWDSSGLWRVEFHPVEITDGIARMAAAAMPVPRAVQSLGERELAVCRLMLAGAYEEQMAEALGISVRSVREAKHSAAAVVGIEAHSLSVWCGQNQIYLEPL